MPTNYANGKIYQIISPNHPLPYIGSTTQPLCKRMAEHRSCRNTSSSRVILEAGDAYIELIEEYPCENREQLNKREGEIIRERECVNKRVAGRTKKEYSKVYREAISARDKVYREAHRETISARMKAYREAHREDINAQRKAYREANREAISAQRKAYRARKKASLTSESTAEPVKPA